MNSKRLYCGVGIALLTLAFLLRALSPWCQLTLNMSQSLSGRLFLIHKTVSVKRGDVIAFYWQGGATYPKGTIFIKRIAGVAGDTVIRHNNAFWVNTHYIGTSRVISRAGVPLIPASEGKIQPNTYFVATPHPDSLDSRYALTGNVQQRHIIGKAYAIF